MKKSFLYPWVPSGCSFTVLWLSNGHVCEPNIQACSWDSEYGDLFYSIVTPLINPVIYSLKNKDMKHAIKKLLGT